MTTKTIEHYAETLQEMHDEGSEHFRTQLSLILDQFDGDNSPDFRRLALLEWLIENGDDESPEDISETTYDDCIFEVGGGSRKYGTSPADSRKNAALVRETLIKLVTELDKHEERLLLQWFPGAVDKAWLSVDEGELKIVDGFGLSNPISTRTLENVKRWETDFATAFSTDEPPAGFTWATYNTITALVRSDSLGLSDVLKIGIHDFANSLYFLMGADKGTPHAEQLREAFDGEPVKDRRRRHWTNRGEYLVCDDDEAESRWDQALENYLDECVEGSAGPYFDREAWKRDARADGRGHLLSSYDGAEYDHRGLCIFRVN